MKKLIIFLLDIVFTISLTLMGKFTSKNLILEKYQIIFLVFYTSGIFKFMISDKNLKKEAASIFKSLIISILVIPVWYWYSGVVDNNAGVTALLKFLNAATMLGILLVIKRVVNDIGTIAYYTYAFLAILSIFFIRYFSMKPILAVALSIFIMEPINYLGYKNKKKFKSS